VSFVELDPDGMTVTIRNLQLKSEEVHKFLSEFDEKERATVVAKMIRVGAAGISRMLIAEGMDYVNNEFQTMITKIDEMFNPDNTTSHLGKLVKVMDEYFSKGGTVEALFNPNVDDTPIGQLRKRLCDEMSDIRDKLVGKEKAAEIKEITTLKGKDFEKACNEIFSNIVQAHVGDELYWTSEEVGEITGSKKGDFVIKLGEGIGSRIVFETKDWKSLTLPQILDKELEEALKNRTADYAIFVSKYREALPDKVGWFNEYRDKMLICALGSSKMDTFFPSILNIAYQWGRIKLLSKKAKEKEIDITTIRKITENLDQQISKLSQIKVQCTNLEKASKKIRELLDDIENGINEELSKLRKALEE
jgi:hypothetical protein